MDYVGFIHSSPKNSNHTHTSRKCVEKFSPEKLIFSGNFSKYFKEFDIAFPERRQSMKKDILNTVMKRTESIMGDEKLVDDNPLYEDPKDVITVPGVKPPKPPRKRNPPSSPRSNKDGKSSFKEEKKRIVKKYEGLITALMQRCEENFVVISEKENIILKLKEKLKTVLEYNKLFAEENDQLKAQYSTLIKYVEDCKRVIREEKEKNSDLEEKNRELEERVKRFEVPDREHNIQSTAIPLVEVCMSCSSRQIIVHQAKEQNVRLQKDMHALKDVLYRLNVQLSRYQEKLRTNIHTMASGDKIDNIHKPSEQFDIDSLITASLARQDGEYPDGGGSDKTSEGRTYGAKVSDLSGLLSAQALAPLFDAYQENLQEKDSLIHDYEKQFENINKKSKEIVDENKLLTEKVNRLEEELVQARQMYKKAIVEKETGGIERATLLERAERAESKLKEVYELYEDKMSAMMRDYETVHRSYFQVKCALDASEGKMAHLDAARARTVPSDLHERRVDACKRLLEELKHQYSMENERKTELLKKQDDQLRSLEEKYNKLCQEHEIVKEQLSTALKNAKLYRKAAVIFRQRVKAAAARVSRVRRSANKLKRDSEPLKVALGTLETIKREIKVVKSKAHQSLEELERRILEQERKAARAQHEYKREIERAAVALEHKEGIIRSLIDKVADIEEVRLSQTNTQRLQGIISDSDGSSNQESEAKEVREKTKMVPTSGGYFKENPDRRTQKN